ADDGFVWVMGLARRGRERFAIGREPKMRDLPFMCFELEPFLRGLNIPEPSGGVVTARSQGPAVRGKRQLYYVAAMTLQNCFLRVRCRVPELNDRAYSDGEKLPVIAVSHAGGLSSFRRQGRPLLARGEIKQLHPSFPRVHGQRFPVGREHDEPHIAIDGRK